MREVSMDEKTSTERESHERHEHEHEGLSGAVFLIFLGTLLLLNTLGVVSWGVWEVLLRFWPLLLILWGIQVLLGGTKWGRIVSGVIALFFFGGIIGLVLVQEGVWQTSQYPSLDSIVSRVTQKSGDYSKTDIVPLETQDQNTTKQIVTMKVRNGNLVFRGQEGTRFATVNSHYHNEVDAPSEISSVQGDTLKIAFEQNERNVLVWGLQGPEYEFLLERTNVPTEVSLESGAGNSTLDFTGVNVSSVKAESGAGNTNILFADDLSQNVSVNIDSGAGNVEVHVPASVGVKVKYSVGVGSVTVGDQKFSGVGKNDASYESSNFGTASRTITIEANVGAGDLKIIQ